MAGTERIVRIVLTGDSAGVVRALGVADAAATRTEGKFARMKAVGSGMTSLGRSMTTLAVPLVALGAYSVKAASSFQDSMTLLRTQVGVGVGEMNRMSAATKALAPKVGEGPNQLAQALYPIESVGLRGAAALNALKAAAVGAQVSGASLTDTADAVAGAMRTQMSDVRSASDAMSIMNGIVAQGKMHLQDLVGAMTTGVLSSAKQAGLGFRDVGAAIAAMTRQGIPAQAEATRLKLNLMQFEAPKAAALKALQSIGLGQFTLADDLRKPHGLVTALSDLRAHLHGLGRDQQNLVLSQAFGGARGSSNVVGLLNALPQMSKISTSLTGSNAAQLAHAFGLRAKDASFKWAQLKAAAQTALVGLGDALMPIVLKYLPKFVSFLTGAVKWVSHLPGPVKSLVVGFVAFLAIGGPILMFLGSLITAIGTIGTMITSLKLITIGFSTVFKASIIGLVIFALIMLITHFNTVKQVAGSLWLDLKAGVQAMGAVLGRVFTGLYAVLTWPFKEAWKIIKGIANAIVAAFNWVVNTVKHTVSTIIGLPGKIIGGLGHAASGALSTATFGLLHTGGPVKAKYLAAGGPSGTDTVLGWLTPGEGVLNRAAMAGIGGESGLNRLNSGMGGMGENITITPSPAIFKVDGRVLAETVVHYTLKRAARGASSLTGGGLMVGANR